MMRLLRHATLGLLLVLSSIVVSAQVATAVPASSGPTSNVAIFYVACEKQGVVNFTGQMQAGTMFTISCFLARAARERP